MSSSLLSRGAPERPLVIETSRGTNDQPFVVDTVWGDDTTATIVLSIISIIATAFVSFMIWLLDRRTEQRNEDQKKIARDLQTKQEEDERKRRITQEQELRLQDHVRLLASTDAMHRIGDFEQKCKDVYIHLPADKRPSYGAVFRYAKPISGNGACVTEEHLRSVDAARKELQGIWDNIYDDFKRNRLPGTITDSSNSRILNRALNYLGAAEPLEAANHARMEDRKQADASVPYLFRPISGQGLVYLLYGVRPYRFFWIENQQAMRLTMADHPQAGQLWKERSRSSTGQRTIEVTQLNDTMWNLLTPQQRQRFIQHWEAVEAAYTQQLPVDPVPPAAAPVQGSQGIASSSAAGPSNDLAQLVARQNVLLEQLLAQMQLQWQQQPAAAAAAGGVQQMHSA